MNIQQTITQKKEHLKQVVEAFNQTQQNLNNLQQEMLRTDGAIRQLQELIDLEKEESKVKINQEVKGK